MKEEPLTKTKKKTYAKLNPAHLRELRERIAQFGFPTVARGTGLLPNTLYTIIRKASTSGVRPSTMQAILAYLAQPANPALATAIAKQNTKDELEEHLDTGMEAFAKVYAMLLPLDEMTQRTVLKAVAKALGGG